MSLLAHLRHPIPATRRAYSFFSKPGGGRYFNSAKPPKSVVAPSSSKPKPTSSIEVGDTNNGTSTSAGTSATSNASGTKQLINTDEDNSLCHSHSPSAPATPPQASPSLPSVFPNSHPIVSSKDFKLHQFFSLHRPLLLLSHPSDMILRNAPLTGPLFSSSQETTDITHAPPERGFEDASETPIDADAEAARQLTRALTMHKAGGIMDWERTLRRLGLDVDMEADRVGLQQQWDKEWEDVMMDSVKRKRRKKMKKHKLKKRRRLTRIARLKHGG